MVALDLGVPICAVVVLMSVDVSLVTVHRRCGKLEAHAHDAVQGGRSGWCSRGDD